VLAAERAGEARSAGRRSVAFREAQRVGRAADRARREAELLRSTESREGAVALSSRELEVLTLASHGFSYSDIARELVVSAATVKTHLAHIYAKLQVTDKAAAVARALRHGLID
jgi:ATP/maltotriose-dependent transcriptional regulator MalT